MGKRINIRLHQGFTLLEMLVAMAIFAALGLMTSQLVTRIVDIDQQAVERGNRILEIQQAMQILDRDLTQISPRPVRNEVGELLPAAQIGGEFLAEFTRLGWRNPLERPRSNLQRLAYFVEDETLYRYYWNVLDRADDSEPVIQTLLENVSSVEFLALDEVGAEHSFWPTVGGGPGAAGPILRGIRLNIEIPPMGEVNRVWAVSQGVLPLRSVPGEGGDGEAQTDTNPGDSSDEDEDEPDEDDSDDG